MSLPLLTLQGRAAIVTGAASRIGIGQAVARMFAEAGADIALCDIAVASDMDAAVRDIQKMGRRALAVHADVTKEADVQNLVQKATAEFGFVDILVNCAGGGPRPPEFLKMSEAYWDHLMDINCKSAFLCSQAASRVMVERKKGSIINISSVGALPRGGVSVYGSAKAALNRLTVGLAHDLGKYNIRVNAIAPGMVRTDLARDMWSDPETLKRYESRLPLGHIAEPEDVAALALFLASDASRMITGAVVPLDGGSSLISPGH